MADIWANGGADGRAESRGQKTSGNGRTSEPSGVPGWECQGERQWLWYCDHCRGQSSVVHELQECTPVEQRLYDAGRKSTCCVLLLRTLMKYGRMRHWTMVTWKKAVEGRRTLFFNGRLEEGAIDTHHTTHITHTSRITHHTSHITSHYITSHHTTPHTRHTTPHHTHPNK